MSIVVSCLLPGAEADRATAGLLGAGQRASQELDATHIAVALHPADGLLQFCGERTDSVVAAGGQDNEYQIEPSLDTLHSICAERDPQLVLLGPDTYSQELAPRLAYRLGGCSIGDAQQIEIDGGAVQVRRSVYGGKALATIRANKAPAVVWLRSRAFADASVQSEPADVEQREVMASTEANPVRIVARHREEEAGTRLEEARVIVSGGRGLGGPEPFLALRELASTVNAEVAASRAACDAGWVLPGLQVGQTGKKVSPDLYLAIAISGASQHLMGIADAKVVAAVNTDPDAPIFQRCQFGLVEDWQKVVAPLREQLAQLVTE